MTTHNRTSDTIESSAAQATLGEAMVLQFTIVEFSKELGIATCKEHSRLVTMAVAGLESQATKLVESMKAAITKAGEPTQ